MILNTSSQQLGQCGEHADMLTTLAAVPDAIRRMIGDRSGDDLRLPGHDGGHAAVELVCHLQDWEEITGGRVWRILNEHDPELESFDDSLWSIEHEYMLRDALEALEAFAIQRNNLVGMLTGIDETAWQRTAELQHHGQVTLQELVALRMSYDASHLAELGEALR